jgi:hypothetical protein
MNVVRIRVTGKTAGVARVFPYDHKINPDEKPLYRVPLYEVRVNESSIFKAIRFGYRGHFEHPWDPHRKCDEGVIVQREVAAEWNGVYSPHSFTQGGGLPGGFRIRSDQVYIHEGPTKGGASGTLSCIEIASDHEADDWNRFLMTVAREAGVQYVGAAVKSGKVLVTVEAAAMPNGLLVGRTLPFTDPHSGESGLRFDGLLNWETTTVPWGGR